VDVRRVVGPPVAAPDVSVVKLYQAGRWDTLRAGA
jgi:hypothetical protein